MYAILNRLKDDTPIQTLGEWRFYEGLKEIMKVCTLELKDLDNAKGVSRIPATTNGIPYKVRKRYSEKHKWHFHITDVPGRSLILVHIVNYYTQIRGCIGVGYGFKYINADKELDLYLSRDTLKRMLAIAPEEFDLYINDNGN